MNKLNIGPKLFVIFCLCFTAACSQDSDSENSSSSSVDPAVPGDKSIADSEAAFGIHDVSGLQANLLKIEARLSSLTAQISASESRLQAALQDRVSPVEAAVTRNQADLNSIMQDQLPNLRNETASLGNQVQQLRTQMPTGIDSELPEEITELSGEQIPVDVCLDFPCTRSSFISYKNETAYTLQVTLEVEAAFLSTGGLPPDVYPPYAYLSAIIKLPDGGGSRELRPIRLQLEEEISGRNITVLLAPGAELRLSGKTSGVLEASATSAHMQALSLK